MRRNSGARAKLLHPKWVVRIPTKSATDSDRCRPEIPTDVGHPGVGLTQVLGIMDGWVRFRSSWGRGACVGIRP